VIRVAEPPASAGAYMVPVRIQGSIRQALVDSGCMQTVIHQSLVRPGALVEVSSWVNIRCVHGDIHKYPLVPVEIKFKGKTHSLILGTDWPGFSKLVGQCGGERSRQAGEWDMCTVLKGDARSSDAVSGGAGVPFSETPRLPELHPVEDFPREQSRDDTLRFGFDQVIKIDGHMVRPDSALSYPHFSLIRDRLYRVSRDTNSAEIITVVHYNPMAGHMGYDKTLDRVMARFYWPGIQGDVHRWCAACPECQLVNPPAIPKAPLRPLPLMEVPFEHMAMDLIGPFQRSARGYRFVLVLVDCATRYPEAVP